MYHVAKHENKIPLYAVQHLQMMRQASVNSLMWLFQLVISQYAKRWHLKRQSYSIMHVRMTITLVYLSYRQS